MTRGWRRPVAFFHNGHGDKLLTLPALRALSTVFAGRLRLVCGAGDGEAFYSELPLAGTCEVEFRREDGRWAFDSAAAADAVGDTDLILFLNPWFSADVAGLAARFPHAETVGFYRQFTHALPGAGRQHAVETAFEVPRLFDPTLRLQDFDYPPRLAKGTVESALKIREALGPPRRVLAVHMLTAADKMWPLDSWRRLLDLFLAEHPDYIVFVFAPQPFGFEAPGTNRAIPVYGLPLTTALALVGMADMFAGIDSCLLHAADLYRVPGVGLFGPTSEREWGFRFGPHRHLRAEGGMENLPVETVLGALEDLVPEYPSELAQ